MKRKSQLCIIDDEVCIIIKQYFKKNLKIYQCPYSKTVKQDTENTPMCIVYMSSRNKIYDVKSFHVEYI